MTIYVYLLTEAQKDALVGVKYNNDAYFNPVQDFDGNWIITIEEISQNTNPDTMWVKDLTVTIPWNPPIYPTIPMPDEE